jgi:hypothetical protein
MIMMMMSFILSFPVVYVGVVECVSTSLPPTYSSLTHAHRMDGFCNPLSQVARGLLLVAQ